jgi:hypothetical protein
MKEVQKVLDELKEVRPEKLTGEAKRLFEAIMKIADERDELLKERQADKEKIKELESDKEIKDKMIELIKNRIFLTVHECEEIKEIENRSVSKSWEDSVIEYFENLAKESGDENE